MYNIVLVHVGDIFYDYINDCIEQLMIYNNTNIYLLISHIHKNKIKHDVNIISLEDIRKTDEHVLFNNTSGLDFNFRNGFWKYASERFYYINDFVSQINITNIIHIENDINLYFNVQNYINIFEEKYNIAATFDSDKRCIPGIMYFKNKQYTNNLIKYMVNINYKNDMEIISDYRYNSTDIDYLPIIHKNSTINNIKYNISTNNIEKYSSNFDIFNSIFDAACIGQYLGGVDPRNMSGNSEGFINESCIFDPSLLNIYWKRINNINEPYYFIDNKEIKINNLHMHCKNLNKFK